MASCIKCDGRGFMWRKTNIVRRLDGAVIAETLRHGDDCNLCGGTGKADRTIDYIAGVAIVAMVLGAFYGFYLLI